MALVFLFLRLRHAGNTEREYGHVAPRNVKRARDIIRSHLISSSSPTMSSDDESGGMSGSESGSGAGKSVRAWLLVLDMKAWDQGNTNKELMWV